MLWFSFTTLDHPASIGSSQSRLNSFDANDGLTTDEVLADVRRGSIVMGRSAGEQWHLLGEDRRLFGCGRGNHLVWPERRRDRLEDRTKFSPISASDHSEFVSRAQEEVEGDQALSDSGRLAFEDRLD